MEATQPNATRFLGPRCFRAAAALICLLALAPAATAWQPFFDRKHRSEVFGEQRNYRIFLPPGYEESTERYPVIYYFHGHSDRYTLELYDEGKDTVPKIAAFVASHDVIAVAADGYVAEHYEGFYGGSPYDVREDGGDYDYGAYFQELIAHIDGSYRTLSDRRHRATSGLSMGGFMSLYLSARYPDLVGSASAFNPGPEFYAGAKGRRRLWRPKDHTANHSSSMVRLVRASGDYISQYHEETRDAYARNHGVDFEFRQDEYHRHWATSIAETFAFHMRAFARSDLDRLPEEFNYTSAEPAFEVRGYRVEIDGDEPGFCYLEEVRQGGMRIRTRRWAPNGPAVGDWKIHVATAPLYRPGERYQALDYNLASGELLRYDVEADSEGRIRFEVDGAGRQISFAGPGTGGEPPILLPLASSDRPLVRPARQASLPLSVYNPRGEAMEDVRIEVSSKYPTVELIEDSTTLARIEPGERVDLSERLRARFTAGAGYFAPARINVRMTYDGWYKVTRTLDVRVVPAVLPAPAEVEILDGRTFTFPVFRQGGNQGGGESIEREVTEGSGDGDGMLEPGEEATFWVRIEQGLDPFDKNNWHRAKIYSDSEWIAEVEDIQENKQREWTGAQNRTSVIRLSPEAPSGLRIELLLENETWSFRYTPEVRYGRENLYQAFQEHRFRLRRYELEVR